MILRKRWAPAAATMTALAILLMGAMPGMAAAATSVGNGNGLRVSPVRTDLTINPGQTQTVAVTVTNVTTSVASLQAIINDFTASNNETGDPAILLNPNQFATSHSLKRFVKPIANFTLQPGQEKDISVVIAVPTTAPGGGYYGAVRFAPASASSSQTVTLAGSVGSLILVKVPGNIKDQMSLSSFDVRKNDSPSSFFTSNKNIDAVVRFKNEGNIQEEPFGKVLLKNRSGKILASYELNNTDPRGNVLPDSIRKFSIPLDKVGSFGMYKIEGNFGYGSNGQLLSASTNFYVVPFLAIILFIVIVLLLVFLVFGLPRLIRRYNQSIIRRARR